ncbi:LysR family transcriptional regulator [Hydrogenophaga sp. 2FB]|uniref:LysR family transcriptional regulator n=1 Tax=Hydrogenophaga sp. 2FB TaxID=2502187 RepID=UPI0010F73684|nr:LysR family transcriptional regulator [Hydrogenophaga sp. 2FB]
MIYPNPRHLRAFVALASSSSFSVAAKEVHLGQPGLSQAIANLERLVGVPLLERTTRTVSLTAAGHDFLEDARRVLAENERLMRRGTEWAMSQRGTLRLLSILSVAQRLLPGVMREFARAHEGASIEVFDVPDPLLRQRLSRREADLGFISETNIGPGEVVLPFLRDPFFCVFPAEHPFARLAKVPTRLLTNEQLILPRRGTVLRSYIDGAISRLNLKRPPVEVEHLATLIGMVESGVGVCLIPALSCPPAALKSVLARPIDTPKVVRRVAFARSRDQATMPLVASFVHLTLKLLESGELALPAGVEFVPPTASAVQRFLAA